MARMGVVDWALSVLPDGGATVLGHALDSDNVRSCGLAVLFFFLLRGLTPSVATAYVPGYASLNKDGQFKFNSYAVALVHATAVSVLCLSLVVFPDRALERDRLYGLSERASFVFSISAGFFLYDLSNCRDADMKVDRASFLYMVHHLASALCYILVQSPFLQYYAVRLLLYELSTPFLNVRNMLLLLGHKGSLAVELSERCWVRVSCHPHLDGAAAEPHGVHGLLPAVCGGKAALHARHAVLCRGQYRPQRPQRLLAQRHFVQKAQG